MRSDIGLELRHSIFDTKIPSKNIIVIAEDQKTNTVYTPRGNVAYKLPFTIVLDKFDSEYYPCKLYVQDKETKKTWNSSMIKGGSHEEV